jgi:hypothetical protein
MTRKAASLGYCGLGTTIKVSAIQFNDDKNLELLRACLGHARDSAMSSVFPQDEETTEKTLHRYFNDKLGSTYIASNCPSKLPIP